MIQVGSCLIFYIPVSNAKLKLTLSVKLQINRIFPVYFGGYIAYCLKVFNLIGQHSWFRLASSYCES